MKHLEALWRMMKRNRAPNTVLTRLDSGSETYYEDVPGQTKLEDSAAMKEISQVSLVLYRFAP